MNKRPIHIIKKGKYSPILFPDDLNTEEALIQTAIGIYKIYLCAGSVNGQLKKLRIITQNKWQAKLRFMEYFSPNYTFITSCNELK